MEKDIGKVKKNDTTDVIIRIDDFGGRKGLTIREFVTSPKYTGFTKSGVRIPVGDFQNFKGLINSIAEEDLKEEEKEMPSESQEESPDQKTLDEEVPDY